MNKFKKIIKEAIGLINILSTGILKEEEANYQFVLELVKKIDYSLEYLKNNFNKSNLVTKKEIEEAKELLKRARSLKMIKFSSDQEQQNIYKVLKNGVEPRVKALKILVNKWQEIHNSKSLQSLDEELKEVFYDFKRRN